MALARTSLQPCLGERLGPPCARGLFTKGPSKLTARILEDDINELNAPGQPLILGNPVIRCMPL
jgi:hypothetical protein